MKRPAFQFYPADWRKDSALQSCSIAARGLWIEMVCVMHECEPYGYLTVNGKAMKPAQLARLVGESEKTIKGLLDELEGAGVFSRDEASCVYSRRMVSDERIRNIRTASGRLGGNPNLLKQKDKQKPTDDLNLLNQKDNQLPTNPLTSERTNAQADLQPPGNLTSKQSPTPSSSSSLTTPLPPSSPKGDTLPLGFARFWESWPASVRKVGKAKCLEKWRRSKLDGLAEPIVEHVEAMKATRQWADGYEPAPLTYLNQRRWEDGLPPADLASSGDDPWRGGL